MLPLEEFHKIKGEILNKYEVKYHNLIIDALYFAYSRQDIFKSDFNYSDYIYYLIMRVRDV